jgi:hypothetical protein
MSRLAATAFRVLAFILPVSVRRVLEGGLFSSLLSLSRMEISCNEDGDVKICLKVFTSNKLCRNPFSGLVLDPVKP